MLRKQTLPIALLLLGAGTLAFGLVRAAPVASQHAAVTPAKIDNAMSAALPSIAKDATNLDTAFDDAGTFIVLREGGNGWFCQPDSPATQGPDPWCFDQTWLDWAYALSAGEAPNPTGPGLAYMLQGGSDASNTDPLATEPAAGEEWITSPPHVMLLLPEDLDPSVFSTDHHSGEPYVMWAGTPYEHIMMPVAEGEHEE